MASALDRERRTYRPRVAPLDDRVAADALAITTLERTILTLTSLLLRARADDAAVIARELESLRRQMASLLAELRRARTPEAMRELAATIARARQRVAELRARMARMGEGSPREFENLGEEDVAETEEALARMEEAVQGDDLDAASRALTGLEQEIDQLARALGQSQEAVAEERFDERERALVLHHAHHGARERLAAHRRPKAHLQTQLLVGPVDVVLAGRGRAVHGEKYPRAHQAGR